MVQKSCVTLNCTFCSTSCWELIDSHMPSSNAVIGAASRKGRIKQGTHESSFTRGCCRGLVHIAVCAAGPSTVFYSEANHFRVVLPANAVRNHDTARLRS